VCEKAILTQRAVIEAVNKGEVINSQTSTTLNSSHVLGVCSEMANKESMEPIAAGFMVSIAAAAVLGIVVGAIGGAVVRRLRMNFVLGVFLTACAYLLALIEENDGRVLWLKAELVWGTPSMMLAFLISLIAARWLEARTKLRPIWTTLAAFGVALTLGFLYLLTFRLSLTAPPVIGLVADAGLLLLLVLSRKIIRNDA
jgi:hypothetical protein